MDYVHLVGTEEVQRAVATIQEAAGRMANVSSNIQLVFEAHQRFLDDWLRRYEGLMPRACPLGRDDGLYCPHCRGRNEEIVALETQLAEARRRA